MKKTMKERFRIRNLDCPACADKLESSLRALDVVRQARVDFAAATLHVTADDLDRVVREVNRLEPGIELVAPGNADSKNVSEEDDRPAWKMVLPLALAAVLFVAQLVTEDWFHDQNQGIAELSLVLAAYLLVGWDVFVAAFKTIRRGEIFDENFLMIIATSGALFIHAYSEAVGVMLFFKVGEILQQRAVNRSRRSIAALLEAKPEQALVKTGRSWRAVDPEDVSVGQVIMVRPGDKVPLDGLVLEGSSLLDSAALTGESLPLPASTGDKVMAGQINQTGALKVRVTRPFVDSSIAKVMDLVQNATARKARAEKFITTFARYYTPAVVMIAAAIAIVPPLAFGQDAFGTWLYRALVLLVISCPCALVISIPLGYFAGIGNASGKGILVKGSNYIDVLAAAGTVVFDKTGTLTEGRFKVIRMLPAQGMTNSRLLEIAAAAEYHSNHPIALAILDACRKMECRIRPELIGEHTVAAGRGVRVEYDGSPVLAGNDVLMHEHKIPHRRCSFDNTVVHLAEGGKYAGCIEVGDRIKEDSVPAMDALRRLGIRRLVMLTGDNRRTAAYVAGALNMDDYYAELLPEDKVRLLEKLKAGSGDNAKVIFVGDGINDAPVIAVSDAGIAMGALGSDAAIEAADVVLMTDSPLKVAEAVAIARKTKRIVWQNIALAFSIKAFFIGLGTVGLATMWEAVFADVGTALLALFNSMRVMKN